MNRNEANCFHVYKSEELGDINEFSCIFCGRKITMARKFAAAFKRDHFILAPQQKED